MFISNVSYAAQLRRNINPKPVLQVYYTYWMKELSQDGRTLRLTQRKLKQS